MDGVDIERTERSDQEEEVWDRFLKELHSEWRLTRCLQIFQEKWGGEMESGFTLGKWGKGQESRWRDWTFSHEELGGNSRGLPMLFQPRASTGCTSLRGEDTGLMLTSSSQGCSQHTERPCGSCHPFFAELPQDSVCRHLTKEGQTRNDISENEIPRVFESCHPMRNSISLAKLIELIYLEFWKDIIWLLVLKISYKNIIFFLLYNSSSLNLFPQLWDALFLMFPSLVTTPHVWADMCYICWKVAKQSLEALRHSPKLSF